MTLEPCIPLLPEGARCVGKELAVHRAEGEVVIYNSSGPIYSFSEEDNLGRQLAGAMFTEMKLAKPKALAEALEMDRSTLFKNRRNYREKGIEGLRRWGSGRRGPHKLIGDKVTRAQTLLDAGRSIRGIAKEIGVTEGAIRHAIGRGQLRPGEKGTETRELRGPSARSREDSSCRGGVGVKRHSDRALARLGELDEAAPEFTAAESVAGAGVLVAVPALLSQGLLEVGKEVYGSLSAGFFGLRAVLLGISFMALLRIKRPEQLKHHSPGEFGIILGLDRAPEVKTLRRKLKEMGSLGLAREFMAGFSRRWSTAKPEALGFLYVDGHVRPYNGKHTLPKTHVSRRRLCMAATTDVWVNDENAEPLFFVTAEANDSLLSMMEGQILPEVRGLVGEERRVTVIFDREGWSPKTFQRWEKQGFDVLTYRKGRYEAWPEEWFREVEARVHGKGVTYLLGERRVLVCEGFRMREVRRLCDDGHQTSVMTTREDLTMEEIASRMFSRWTQENFFRYMRHEYDVDHLCTYAVESADPQRLVPNPARKEKKKELKKLRTQLRKLEATYGKEAHEHAGSRRAATPGLKRTNAELGEKIRELQKRYQEMRSTLKALPEKVPLEELLNADEIVRLDPERKIVVDVIKMVAYRAETSLFNYITPFFARHEDEGRAFLKAVFQLPADIVPEEERECLVVRFHSMANRRHNETLKALCEVMNQENCLYPGTNLQLVFQAV